jgi:GST-like protein
MFQMSGLGPHFGQLMVWAGAWGNEFPQVTSRYQQEVNRLFKVLDHYLEDSTYMAGDAFSIADIAFIPWIRLCHINPIGEMLNLSAHKNLNTWYELVSQRPAVQKGLSVPTPHDPEVQFKAFVSAVVGLGELHNA